MKNNPNFLDTQQAIRFLTENQYRVEALDSDTYRVTMQGGVQQIFTGRTLVEYWREQLRRKQLIQDSTQKKTSHYELLEEKFVSQQILDETRKNEYRT